MKKIMTYEEAAAILNEDHLRCFGETECSLYGEPCQESFDMHVIALGWLIENNYVSQLKDPAVRRQFKRLIKAMKVVGLV